MILKLVVALAIFVIVCAKEFPADLINVCKKNNPKMDECLLKTLKTIAPKFIKGLPEYNISTFEPITLSNLSFDTMGLKLKAITADMIGLSKMQIKRIKMVEFGKTYRMQYTIPQMYSVGDYNVQGKYLFLVLNITGNGKGNYSDVLGDLTFHFDDKVVNGKNHKILSKLDISLSVKDGYVIWGKLEGIDSPTLSELLTQLTNQSFKEFAKDMLPACGKIMGKLLRKSVNKILAIHTAEELFPE